MFKIVSTEDIASLDDAVLTLKSNMLKVAAAAIIVIAIIALYLIHNASLVKGDTGQQTTTINLSSISSCNGYVLSASQPLFTSRGACNWHGGIANVTINGGMFTNVELLIEQLNSTPPFSAVYNGSTCKATSGDHYMPSGNYKISLTTGPASTSGGCGNATIRLSSG